MVLRNDTSLNLLSCNASFFFKFSLWYVSSDFTEFVDSENIGVDTRIVILGELELDILARLNFQIWILIRIYGQ